MGLRPGRCYRKLERPYTRTSKRKPRLSYVKGVPQPKIVKFVVGNKKRDFPHRIVIVSKRPAQVRHNALEATRITLNKALEKRVGKDAYRFQIHPYPHHVMRENPLATGAGADRFSQGMRKAFGKPIGKAAQIRAGQRLITVLVDREKDAEARKAIKVAVAKLPVPCVINSAE
jgi:large subunit ribosomal protein L10e